MLLMYPLVHILSIEPNFYRVGLDLTEESCMWIIDPVPLEIVPCTKSSPLPLSYSYDDEFPECTYCYIVANEDPRCVVQMMLNPACVAFVPPQLPQSETPLGGRAWRMLWQRRMEIPEAWWQECERGLPFAQFYFTGVDVRNPHGVRCWPYLRRRHGVVCWGFHPVPYNWGVEFPAIVLSA